MQRQGLFRSRTDKVFGGVAGGIAKTLNTDSALIRLIFALLVIFGGGGLLLYIILWIAIPEEPLPFYQEMGETAEATRDTGEGQPEPQPGPLYPPARNNGALIAGLIMIVIGAVFLADRFIPRFHFGDFWPIVIVIAGAALIFSSFAGNKRA